MVQASAVAGVRAAAAEAVGAVEARRGTVAAVVALAEEGWEVVRPG